jgi:hypothetical protein
VAHWSRRRVSVPGRADDGSLTFVKGVHGPPSLPAAPWVQPMPILPIKAPVNPFDPKQMPNGPPDGTTLINGAKDKTRVIHLRSRDQYLWRNVSAAEVLSTQHAGE